MCGLTGFFDIHAEHGSDKARAIASGMANAIAHRGPDDSGVWQDEHSNLTLAHRRLSILDLSQNGHQPKESPSGRYIIAYNGEIYNFPVLQKMLQQKGALFQGSSDTEVLLTALDHWGIEKTLEQIKGMFAFALWDKAAKKLYLVRDRLGKKPLYVGWRHHQTGDSAPCSLVFGSELKAILAYPAAAPDINRAALGLYMQYGYVPAPCSILDNIWQLKPGTYLCLSESDLRAGQDLRPLMRPYWDMAAIIKDQTPFTGSAEDAKAQCRDLIESAVKKRMISDVPLGAFLSGGIDSSLVTAMMQQNSPRRVQTFAIGFEEAGFNEAPHAAAIAAHLGTDHHELYIKANEARDIIPDLPHIYDEPFADISQIPMCLLSRFARQHVTVALSGDGGDEICAGYVRHFALPALWKRAAQLPRPLRSMVAKMITALSTDRWDQIRPNHPQFGDRMHKAAAVARAENFDEAYRSLMRRWESGAPLLAQAQNDTPLPLDDMLTALRDLSPTERMMAGDSISYLPNDILVKVDRATMAYGLEARAPLLDTDLFAFMWSLPLAYKTASSNGDQGFQGKGLLRNILHDVVPPEMFERPKQGFAVPMGAWLRGPLKEWADDLLDPAALKDDGFFDAGLITATWQEHLNGRGRHTDRLWTVLMFQSWYKAYKKQNLVIQKRHD
jgi:asparagine synthase (glutamine-hydrolysing)